MRTHNCAEIEDEDEDESEDESEYELTEQPQRPQRQQERQQREQQAQNPQQREQQAQNPQQQQRQKHKQRQPTATPQPPVAAPPRYSSLRPMDMPFNSAAACRSSAAYMIKLTSPAKPSLKPSSSALRTSKSSVQIGHPPAPAADPASTQKMLARRHYNSMRSVVVEAGGAVYRMPTMGSISRIHNRSES
ncbi:unnamed protein product [Tilletia laevis]|uniref:Uncharacterized protein n=1 Tax=Tilletia laevis TaxID=157183 RepID=A0A9N8LD95_9BASI|nr:unnamed protein product [Tilletia caries]CAD6909382.1 unnamed protein product [Tilletia laevis]CAD6962088.1 unnamed protein product [Tilletia laevis]CAD6974634.1 unnamed protein product [Tilletia controversa]CAD7060275.1 unnamed protein product [Tilletia caries]